MQERIAVIGLGYVGLPVALAFARKFPGAIGFDVNKEKVEELRRGFDRNQEVPRGELKESTLTITQRDRPISRASRSSSSPFRRPSTTTTFPISRRS